MALFELAIGNSIVNAVPLTVLSEPKSRMATDLLPCVSLYISAALAVNEAEDQVVLANEMYAVGIP